MRAAWRGRRRTVADAATTDRHRACRVRSTGDRPAWQSPGGCRAAYRPGRKAPRAASGCIRAGKVHEVVHVHVAAQTIDLGERVVGHALDFTKGEVGGACPGGKFGGTDELGVI